MMFENECAFQRSSFTFGRKKIKTRLESSLSSHYAAALIYKPLARLCTFYKNVILKMHEMNVLLASSRGRHITTHHAYVLISCWVWKCQRALHHL